MRFARTLAFSCVAASAVAADEGTVWADSPTRGEDPFSNSAPQPREASVLPTGREEALPVALDPDRLRLRSGFDINGGTTVGRSAIHTVALRLGVQANRTLGVYYQGQLGVSAGHELALLAFNSVLGSLVLNDVMEIAAGPSFDVRAGSVNKGEGVSPGVAARMAFMLGRDAKTEGNRSGVSLVFHVYPSFIRGEGVSYVRTVFAFGIGGEWY